MVGGFQQGNDGHIYFVANNQTGATFNIQIVAASTDRNNSETKTMTPNGGFYLGPTTPWRWYWKRGDKISVVYANGQSSGRGSALKATALTIVLMLHFEGNIVQER